MTNPTGAQAEPAAELGRGKLVDALYAGAAGRRGRSAAVEVLCRGAYGVLLDHVRPYITGDVHRAEVDWPRVVLALMGGNLSRSPHISHGGAALLRLAASLAGYERVNLAELIGALDRMNRRVVLGAMFTATDLGGSIDGLGARSES